MHALPVLISEDLVPTRDYLRDVALVMGKLQQLFLPVDPHDWQRGLEVGLRGLVTQPFVFDGKQTRATLDLVKHKLRFAGTNWLFEEYDGPELYNNLRVFLTSHGVTAKLEKPEFANGPKRFDTAQATAYAEALWWMDKQLRIVKAQLSSGLTSPILVYPHHFDLSLAWFPHDDERQLTIGWSTGDSTIAEPYVYITAYPAPPAFTQLELPMPAYWQREGFSGAILPYSALQRAKQPEQLFQDFAATLQKAALLFG